MLNDCFFGCVKVFLRQSAKLPFRCHCEAMAFLLTPFCRCAAGVSVEATLEDGDKNDIKQEGSLHLGKLLAVVINDCSVV